jgi:uncharacterized protein
VSAVSEPRAAGGHFGGYGGPVIDTDVHVNIGTVHRLFPYLEDGWVQWIESLQFQNPLTLGIHYPPNAPTTVAAQFRQEGKIAASDYETLRDQLLDPYGIETAIINPYWGLDGLRQPELAARLATAINDWLADEFLSKDDRLRGSITTVHHDPAQAIREINQRGEDRRFVQVHLPIFSTVLWGKRIYHPLFHAIADNDLVATLHLGGSPEATPTPTGWTSYYMEHLASISQIYMSQIVNIVCEGLLLAVPNLRMAIQEAGFAWLPGILWRMDKEWKGLRRGIPWVTEAPSETLARQMRFSIGPLDGVPVEEMKRVVEWFGNDEFLLYGSDYPHDLASEVGPALDALDADVQRRLMAENAREFYRL